MKEKIIDTLWNSALTVMIYTLFTTLFYQVILNEDLKASIVLGAISTLIARFGLAKALQGVEADFNIYRETLTLVGLIITTYMYYE